MYCNDEDPHWLSGMSADLVVAGVNPAVGGNLLDCKRGPLHTAFSFHPPDMTKILLIRISSIHLYSKDANYWDRNV